MCGIAGLINARTAVSPGSLTRFVDSLQHRGPDGRGVWIDGSVGLAHRRLAILDPDARANCPLEYAAPGRRKFVITFNGAVYNFLELRRELEACGHIFRTTGDTEVVAAAFAEWGAACLGRLNGMWAMAIWDAERRELFLARDRFGVKPFYYVEQVDFFAFASELKAFGFLDGFVAEMDRESAILSVGEVFALEATDRTLTRGVRSLPAGHFAWFGASGLKVERWWCTANALPEIPNRFEDQVDEYRRVFDEAVRVRLRSDVAIGTSLSGGFDSTAVLCSVARLGREHGERAADDYQRAFTAVFPGSANDETESARMAAAYAGVQLTESNFQAMDPLEDIEKVLYDFEGFYLTLPTPIWRIYREIRRGGARVSMDGHGADEAIGAYKNSDFAVFHDAPGLLSHPMETWRRIQAFAMSPTDPGGKCPAGWGPASAAAWRSHPSLAFARSATQRLERIREKAARRRGLVAPRHFLLKSARNAVDASRFIAATDADRLPGVPDALNNELYQMFHRTILPTLLRNYDRMSMAHGVEVRMPFMDWRLVTLSFALPAAAKIGAMQTKRIAREALRDRMPEEIRSSRVKIGFNAPMADLMASRFRDFVESVIPAEHDLIDVALLRRTISACARTGSWKQNAPRIWRTVHFLWFEKYFFCAR